MKLYDSVAVFEWYTHAFSKDKVGEEREIKPGDVRFSMNDIIQNFENIPDVDLEETIDTLVKDFDEISGQTYVKIDHEKLSCDMGYGMEAIKFFAKILKDRFRDRIGYTQMFYCWEDEESEAAE